MAVPAVVTSQLNRFTPQRVFLPKKSNVAKPIASQPVIQNAVTLGGSATPPTTNPTSAQSQVIGGSPIPNNSGLGNIIQGVSVSSIKQRTALSGTWLAIIAI